MSVENKEVIDFISISSSNKVTLTISDHLKWSNENHFFFFLYKINKKKGLQYYLS